MGKNAWLIGNAQLEEYLLALEREVVGVREGIEGVNRERKEMQVGDEIGSGKVGEGMEVRRLEEEWRSGVGGLVGVWAGVRELGG